MEDDASKNHELYHKKMQEFAVASEKWHLMFKSAVFFGKPYRISVIMEFSSHTLVQNLASKLQLRNS